MKTWTTKNNLTITRILSGRCNCFLISHHNRFLLVDTSRTNKWHVLQNRLEQLGLNANSIIAVILTHSHFDHAENAANLKAQLGAKVIIHRNEAEFLERGDNPAITGNNFITRRITDLATKLKFLERVRFQPVTPDILVNEHYDLNELGFPGHLLHTPGHTPGSMSVIVDDEIAIVGDTMFGVFPGSVFPPYAENPGEMVRSWQRLLDSGCSLFLPAHGSERNREALRKEFEKKRKK